MMKCDKIEKAYRCIVEGSATDPADLLKSRLQCTSEEADALALELVMLGMSEDNIRTIAKLIIAIKDYPDYSEFPTPSVDDVKEACEGWMNVWNNSEELKLSVEDLGCFYLMQIASSAKYRNSHEFGIIDNIQEHIQNIKQTKKVVKAMLMNMSISVNESFMYGLYDNLIENGVIGDEFIVESLAKRLHESISVQDKWAAMKLLDDICNNYSINASHRKKAAKTIVNCDSIKDVIQFKDYCDDVSAALKSANDVLESQNIHTDNRKIVSLLEECLEKAKSTAQMTKYQIELIQRRLNGVKDDD